MAPPQVDLGKKQPLENVSGWAEKMPSSQAAVVVETGKSVAGRRILGQRRCKFIIIGVVIGILVMGGIAAGVFFGVFRREGKWRGRVEKDGHESDEYIQPDGSKQVIHVTRDENGNFYKLQAVLDYNRKMAGFLDFRTNRCYLDTLRESYEEGCKRWYEFQSHARRPMLRPMRLVEPELDRNVLQYIGGPEIANLCQEVPTYWVVELPQYPQDSSEEPEDHHPGMPDDVQPEPPMPPPPGSSLWDPTITTRNPDDPTFETVYL